MNKSKFTLGDVCAALEDVTYGMRRWETTALSPEDRGVIQLRLDNLQSLEAIKEEIVQPWVDQLMWTIPSNFDPSDKTGPSRLGWQSEVDWLSTYVHPVHDMTFMEENGVITFDGREVRIRLVKVSGPLVNITRIIIEAQFDR